MGRARAGVGRVLLLGCLLLPASVGAARGQSDTTAAPTSPPAAWRLVADGGAVDWTAAGAWPLDSLDAAARAALHALQQEGHYFARLDSVRMDSSRTPPAATFFATPGPRVDVGRVRLDGAAALDSTALLALMDTRPGRPLDPQRLEADLEALLVRYERAGFPLVQAHVEDVALLPGEPPRLDLLIRLDEGSALKLRRVEVVGATRTQPRYVARVADLRLGRPLTGYDPDAIRQRLEATAFFQSVGLPELLVEGDTAAVVRIPLEEESPGAFDLVLGYLPPAGAQGSGSLVGNGHLDLRNLFGDGRRLSLRLNRLPGQVSSVDVRAADPFILGLPLDAEVRFEGFQQDSTYGKQRYGLEMGYRLAGGLHVFGTLNREQTRPGAGGERLVGGRQRVARAGALFAGLGLRYQRLDRRVNPRRGFFLETNFERGRKERTARRVTAAQDTTRERVVLRQERLRAEGRLYLPTFTRQVAVLGGETALLFSNEYDASDLFRLGGATSLRGYNEEQFRGRFVARLFTEYRFQIDRTSYAFLFFDLGYQEQPEIVDLASERISPALRGVHPGFGLGFQVGTDLGLINLSLAANPDDPTGVRAHLGLSLGL